MWTLVVLAMMLALLPFHAAGGQIDFRAPRVIEDFGASFTVGDFDEDGNADFVVLATPTGHGITVFAGDGQGTYSASTVTPLPVDLYSPLTGDFNEDGHLDLVAHDAADNELWVLMGDGGAGFTLSYETALGVAPTFAVGNFAGDSNLDIVVATSGGTWSVNGTLSVLVGNGNGGFQIAQEMPVGAAPHILSEVADFDGDGNNDIVCASRDPFLLNHPIATRILEGDGNGQFLDGAQIPLMTSPRAIADMNGDGNLDVIGISLPDLLVIAYGDGQGGFPYGTFDGTFDQTNNATPADMNGDGNLDLILVSGISPQQKTFRVLLGDSNSNFTLEQEFILEGGYDIYAGDWNGDGNVDLVGWFSALAILEGTGTGGLVIPDRLEFSGDPYSIAAGDFNEDGQPDIVAANHSTQPVPGSIWLSDGAGGFLAEQPLPGTNTFAASVAVTDLNQDGHLDVTISGDLTQILLGDGTGGFTEAAALSLEYPSQKILVADFNEDGVPDLANAEEGIHGGEGGVKIHLGDDTGSYTPESLLETGLTGSHAAALGDFNEDGHVDIVTAEYLEGTMSYLAGNGDGSFASPVTFSTGSLMINVATGDVDADGHLDAILGKESLYGNGNLYLFCGDGNGGFSTPIIIPSPPRGPDLALEDLDADGYLDLLVPLDSSQDWQLSIYPGNGTVDLSSPQSYLVGASPVSLATADFNADGLLDIATCDRDSGTISILYNESAVLPSFLRGDLNGDSAVDLADAAYGLSILFTSLGPAPCDDACDVNDDDSWNIADMITLLNFLFASGPTPPAPYPGCGIDPTPGTLGCDAYGACP